MVERKGPTPSATLFKKGTTKLGNDGNMWIIMVDKNGRHRWKKITASRKQSKSKAKSRKTRSKKSKAKSRKTRSKKSKAKSRKTRSKTKSKEKSRKTRTKNQSSEKHYILFTEPSLWIHVESRFRDKVKRIKQGSDTYRMGKVFHVTSSLLKVLRKSPKRGKCPPGEYGNSYIFGKKYPIDSYKFIGSHENDVAQTGFIEVDKWESYNGEKNINYPYTYWEKAYPNYNWDDRKGLAKIQQIYPGVLFVGKTVGGDVGANLWGHYNSKGELDSIIIDNNCLFKYE